MIEVFLTIIIGVSVLVIGNFILEIYLKPFDEGLKTLEKIKQSLNFYAREISEPGLHSTGRSLEASNQIRAVAVQTLGLTASIRGFSFFRFFGLLPSKKDLEKIYDELLTLSNCLNDKKFGENNRKIRDKIVQRLSKRYFFKIPIN
jgi:hypothetical protein